VEVVEGIRIARVRIMGPLKQCRVGQRFAFLAERTWACDISDAVPDESALLMLTAAPKKPFPDYLRGKPTQFARARRGRLRSVPLYVLCHSGNGRLPIERRKGGEWVQQPPYVVFPNNLPSETVTMTHRSNGSAWQEERRYVLLTEMRAVLRRYLSS
jgi:hypothetical protein